MGSKVGNNQVKTAIVWKRSEILWRYLYPILYTSVLWSHKNLVLGPLV